MGEVGGKKPKVVIVGAGLAGLAAGQRLYNWAGDILDIVIVEAGDRIGGRILTSEFAGAQVEIGATWIHGIDGSPIYKIARKAGALIPDDPATVWERMDGFPSDPLTLAEGGLVIDPSLLGRISAVFSQLKHLIVSGETKGKIASVGEFLHSGFESYRAKNRADWMDEAAFAMHECGERTYTAVDDLESLDLAAEKEYSEFPGEHITLPGGYSRVPKFLAASLPPGTIRLRRKVSQLKWHPDGLAGGDPVRILYDDGEVEFADHAIVTVSLGVLKAGVINGDGLSFSPALPKGKIDAIGQLGFGLVTKLFMELEGEEGQDKSPFPFLRMAFDPSRHVAEIPQWIRRTDSICPIHGGSRVLLAWFVGREAAEVEKMDDDDIVRGIHATFNGFSPSPLADGGSDSGDRFGRISSVRKSGWGKDPRFSGSYSYVAVGSSGDDQDALADPLPSDSSLSPMQILFAGEATHRTRYATTHGAYLSGVREADRLLRHYGIYSFGS